MFLSFIWYICELNNYKMLTINELNILNYLQKNPFASSKEIYEHLQSFVSYATTKRLLSDLLLQNLVATKGKGKATKYYISEFYDLLRPINLDVYFAEEIDERIINSRFNFNIFKQFELLKDIFKKEELEKLDALQQQFLKKISELSPQAYKNEFERLAIDLSWKSSQIEGNTYSLLETERLLKEKQTASGKTKDEAVMLLNHKKALDFIIENPDFLTPLTIATLESIHSILIQELSIEKNIRRRRVGISGTNYVPLDNEFQIKEALESVCFLVNKRKNIFEKALLVLLLLSYIQPFNDGNKRTARIVSNAILIHYTYCPLSFRTVDSIEYKKAMFVFYEQNNIQCFKEIFINQFEFAVNTYF